MLSIVGTGKMAQAIIKGLKDKFEIEVVGRDLKKLKKLESKNISIKTFEDFSPNEKTIILAIKPNALNDISKYLNGSDTIISILAGVSLEILKNKINAKSYIRAMPNLAAIYKKSMTTITGDKSKKDMSLEIFKAIGNVVWVETQKELDIATAIAGSGPAFLALVAEAMMDAGVKEGLKRELSKELVEGLFDGFKDLLKNSHPAILKDEVMSPAGTTAQGYAALEDGKVRAAFLKAINLAFKKTQH